MAIVVATDAAIELIAAGAASNFAGSELFEISDQTANELVRVIYCRADKAYDQLVIIATADDDLALPAALRRNREAAFNRMLNFAQRARTYPTVVPRGWKQYKHDNLLSFFALPQALGATTRWIAEVNAAELGDVIFWEVTDSDDQTRLTEYVPDRRVHLAAREAWITHRQDGLRALTGRVTDSAGVDVTLDVPLQPLGVAKARTYSQWLSQLTPSQRDFVEAPTDRSIRLRGPAGSGKTLTLALKAVGEVTRARAEGKSLRVLVVTHSWSLAGEVDSLVELLSELGPLEEVTVLPLVAVAESTLPVGLIPKDLKLIGDDSLTGKMTQLAEIEELVQDFKEGDWVTFRDACSSGLRDRLESTDPTVLRGLAWDLLVEFGCVLGADGIFPGVNAEKRYLRIHRAPWMMRLETDGDTRAAYAMYTRYYDDLQERRLLTSDQLLNDFLNYLEGFTWNHRRTTDAYDLIFVDEFHLFNTLERHVLRYLSRELDSYPRLFMALDPSQSPWAMYFDGAEAQATVGGSASEDELDLLKTVDIPAVHRSSPQILDLVKHIHLEYANLNLDEDWGYSISEVESLATPGPIPSLFLAENMADEELAIYKAVTDTYSQSHAGAQLAFAVIDEDAFRRYSKLLQDIGASGKYRVIPITSRDDVDTLQYHKRGIVVGPAEYLAGLQFDTVLIAGLPEIAVNTPNQGVRRRGALSLLYLAVSRASREVRLFANNDTGGVPDVLSRARDKGLMGLFKR